MSTQQPYCKTAQKWVRERLGKSVFAPFTGQDFRAFQAFVHLLDLYACSDAAGREHALLAMRSCIAAMQPKTRWVAKGTIPHVLDWGDEERIWSKLEQKLDPVLGDVQVIRAVALGELRNGEEG
jgi:hypothetical protein